MFKWLAWLCRGKPMRHYDGYHCGCCGRWVAKPFDVPAYQSIGQWADGWGLCEYCEDLDYDVCVRCERRFSEYNPNFGGQMCRHCWASSL